MRLIVAKRSSPNGLVLIVTDKEIMGKVFEEKKKVLDLRNKFYQGEEWEAPEVEKILETAYLLHLTGTNAVNLGIKKEFVNQKKILMVRGIPHAEVIRG